MNAADAAKPLSVLHLEDNCADREMVSRMLSRDGLVCQFHQVKTRVEFEAALREQVFDIIISDFSMPSYDGLSALAVAQKVQPKVPFVFVSGTIGEERAVETLKSGATDYVLKERLDRLGAAIRRALREAQERKAREQAEEALRSTQERLNYLLANSPAIIYALKIDGETLAPAWVSENIHLLLGYTAEEVRQPGWWAASVHPSDRETVVGGVEKLFAEGHAAHVYRVKHKQGEYRWVSDERRLVRGVDGKPIEIIGSWTDVTEHKQLEEQLLRSQKMEAIGKLAGGVAHDFNNLLTVIRGNTELLLMSEEQLASDSKDWLKQVIAASDRAAGLTRQLLLFGRKQTMQPKPLKLSEMVTDLMKMLKRIISADICIECRSDTSSDYVQADLGMMEQVLMNLVVNARDAMPKGGTLTICAEVVRLSDEECSAHPERRAGEFARLVVKDTGCGIASEHLQSIFEPFFTTKEIGKGTGLGLATVYTIVKQHRGWVEVGSVIGQGTVFAVYLPAIPTAGAQMSKAGGELKISGGNETILLVEDDESVRLLAGRVLKNLGYRVCEAISGREALEIWQKRRSEIDLLLTDLMMPDGVTGQELGKKLRLEKPGLKVIFSTGQNHDPVGEGTEFFRRTRTHFLQKPYSSRALAQLVRESLDGGN
jgi:hypothetical protein